MSKDKTYWFSEKVIGYGSGPPIAWQGWALLGGYLAIMALSVGLIEWDSEVGMPVGIAIMVPTTIAFMAVLRAKTRGGWRWRWPGKD